ncbi:hypothetical protein LN042_11445 [Kitasatospora sp. RB6PN24]|uniref:hypothetical protein n=1 Tax=Kitasatospora humi TaxID=2893891 RepID=UPI001E31B6BF|nr:hypothetical protein [Kitasatospora humi]MCC9307703.1 hypothetical protein [Kitasatospora humi]
MADRMDQLLIALDHQGFKSWQADSGMWVFSRGMVTITFHRTPITAGEWLDLVNVLRGAGLVFPEE